MTVNALGFFRRQRTGIARATLTAFAAAWLLLAWQPCVQAFGLDQHTAMEDCLHCPPPVQDGHCAEVVEPVCVDGDASLIDQTLGDPRSGKAFCPTLAPPPHQLHIPDPPPLRLLGDSDRALPAPHPCRPLILLFGVFLK